MQFGGRLIGNQENNPVVEEAAHFYKPAVPKLNENQFEEWRIEVRVMLKSKLHQQDLLKQAVRNSLTGSASKVLLTMRPDVSVSDIVEKLESIYGNVKTGESVVEEFYMAKTKKKMKAFFSCGIRLECLMEIAIEKGNIQENQRDSMLRTRFWKYLANNDLKKRNKTILLNSKVF